VRKDYIDFAEQSSPAGYLITFRCYGTWLHGDERGSVDRNHQGYGTPMLLASAQRRMHDRRLMKQPPVRLSSPRRRAVESGIRETCSLRKWSLWTVNVRKTHVHAVISANKKPAVVLTALKANATRAMREAGCWLNDSTPWAHGGSKKYLWNEKQLVDAIAYVECDQGEPLK
jgi:REP element-mobilizing transposase RayT